MSNKEFLPFEYPEIKGLFGELFDKLLSESDRGAILIGQAYVEDFLTKFIEDVLPDKGKKYKTKLLEYPGPLSSFSAKIELAFAFRLINENLYGALTELRKIRNDAAHKSISFLLTDLKDRLNKVYNLGDGVTGFIREISIKWMMEMKFESLKSIFDKFEVPEEKRKERVLELLGDKKILHALEKQLPHWELILGLCLLC
ncbi:MAG TPA: hypothetical protein VJY62_17525, partial [Bacteroidia bacterium]|nr:hypothetical protein [Bacteroidia bacterium]